MLGRIHTREEPDCGPAPPVVGSATAPTVKAHTPGSVPAPTVRVTVGSVPSASSAAGVGLWVAMSEEIGTQPTQIAVTKKAAGARQLIWRIALVKLNPSSNGAISRARPKRPAHAMTRLARIAVLVQNSRVVGPRSRTDSRATITPKTNLDAWPSGTVRGSGTMNKAKIRTS